MTSGQIEVNKEKTLPTFEHFLRFHVALGQLILWLATPSTDMKGAKERPLYSRTCVQACLPHRRSPRPPECPQGAAHPQPSDTQQRHQHRKHKAPQPFLTRSVSQGPLPTQASGSPMLFGARLCLDVNAGRTWCAGKWLTPTSWGWEP